MRNILFLCLLCAIAPVTVHAQDDFRKFKNNSERKFEKFKKKEEKKFESFREQRNQEYADFVRKAWKGFQAMSPMPMPLDEKTIPPTVYPQDKPQPLENKQKTFDEIIPIPQPEPQPQPIEPIEEKGTPVVEVYFHFTFYQTEIKVRLADSDKFQMKGCSENDVAEVWELLSQAKYAPLINDCLIIRSQYALCDWAYLGMLRQLADSFLGKNTNESTMLTAFLYCQSGYKMRMARSNGKLYMLFASKHTIYKQPYFTIDNETYYPLKCPEKKLEICQVSYPHEKEMSLYIKSNQKLGYTQTSGRRLNAKKYPDMLVETSTNQNLIDFYRTYPSSEINQDFMTRWAMYANTPLCQETSKTLYGKLKASIAGLCEKEAVGKLLNFVQTAFPYEYDNKIWGGDRAFFAEETLYYPYCDCEDRSILFSRLVRDLLHLDVILVYYPGHLATAVAFTGNVTGDYLQINGKKYTVCDPTYINAPVGSTMPGMDNQKAKVILLK